MTPPSLPVVSQSDCWNRIGVWGDRSCPELLQAVHCHNCPVFGAASRRFLDGPHPAGYLEEWTERLAAPTEETSTDVQSVLIFRLGEEWLALPVEVLIEVTGLRPVHRVPHRAGLLAGLVNIRGELQLCVHLNQLVGMKGQESGTVSSSADGALQAAETGRSRMIVVESEGERWVFPVDEIDQVYRVPTSDLTLPPATLFRSAGRLTRAVFAWQERSIGLLEDGRLFQALRARGQ
jgi:chemotaxis-related protein WspD